MSIVGLDEATLTAESVEEGRSYLLDFGLVEAPADGGYPLFLAQDNTGVRVASVDAPDLPAPVTSGPNIREIVWGVDNADSLDSLAKDLSTDREIRWEGNTLKTTDLDGNALAFRVTRRKPLQSVQSLVNVPGLPPQRPLNTVQDFASQVRPLTFSHIVLYTPDLERILDEYTNRLGFKVTDRFTGAGAFIRASGHSDHHQLFFLQKPDLRGLNHLAFHLKDHTEVMVAGKAFANKGWTPAWGPGRHIFGGNCFWYFKSPFGGNVEFDADMDVVDDSWHPREAIMGPDTAAVWLTTVSTPTGKH
jgi:catechol 2,3-dioxygenase-like lactoylglutathione lyase family enzyme